MIAQAALNVHPVVAETYQRSTGSTVFIRCRMSFLLSVLEFTKNKFP
jgi:hypothetical protein